MKKAMFLSLLTTLAGASMAYAQAPATSAQPEKGCEHGARAQRFEKLDANNNGSVSRDEMLGKATERFDRADANKDGSLTADERKAAHQRFAEEHFKKSDKNGDGALTRDEVPPHFAGFFAKLDTDKNGKLTPAELKAGHDKLAQRFEHKHPQADATKTRAELVAHVNARFDRLDTDKDGALSPEELGKDHFGHRGGHWRRHAKAG